MGGSDRTRLGDRMKSYEQATRSNLPTRTYTIVRLDGRAFHTYLRGAAKPFDYEFMDHMDETAKTVCADVSGAVLAYTQSDEISVLVSDLATPQTQPWFGGEVQKIVSVTAALASVTLSRLRPAQAPAVFDSRVFAIANPDEVAQYFLWRQGDCRRNAVTMAAQAVFSHRQLHGVGTAEKIDMLAAKGIRYDQYPAGARRGRLITRQTGERPVSYRHGRTGEYVETTAVRSWWAASEAPDLYYLDRSLPVETPPEISAFRDLITASNREVRVP